MLVNLPRGKQTLGFHLRSQVGLEAWTFTVWNLDQLEFSGLHFAECVAWSHGEELCCGFVRVLSGYQHECNLLVAFLWLSLGLRA